MDSPFPQMWAKYYLSGYQMGTRLILNGNQMEHKYYRIKQRM